MLAEERYGEILRIVNEEKAVTVQKLTELLDTSESTIRRDLTTLHKRGELIKVHGGATAIESGYMTRDAELSVRSDLNREAKMKIGKYAATLVKEDDFVYLDAGSSVDMMIDHLTQSDAVYVTNSIFHAQKLLQKGFRVCLIGGELKAITEAIVGADAITGLRKYNFTKGFFGTNGVHLNVGYTTPDIAEAMVKEKAMEQCKECFILADADKINQISSVTFSSFEDAKLITTEGIDTSYRKYKNVVEV
ncbi:MAG: DeoR/GlpR family DNA-binding transcription regulator [Lachnospiraceae bacterium]|nr:DeoR/GlpR family DNA-binding transcription regulator [Lachnospiraceae bacterium]